MIASKGIAHAEKRRELLEDSAGRVVRSRSDLLPRECGEVIEQFASEKQVIA